MKFFLILIIIITIYSHISKGLKQSPKIGPKEKNPFSDMSDAELEKMMKEYDLEAKDIGILSSGVKEKNSSKKKSSLSLAELNEDDPLKTLMGSDKKSLIQENLKIQDIHSKNKEVLRRFDLRSNDAANIISYMSQYNILNKLPVTAMNVLREVNQKESF